MNLSFFKRGLRKQKRVLRNNEDIHASSILSFILIISFFAALIHLFINLSSSFDADNILQIVSVFILGTTIYLNNNGKFYWARFVYITGISLIIFSVANLVSKDNGVFLLFFPMMGCVFIFYSREYMKRNLMVGFLIILILILEFSEYQAFGQVIIQRNATNSFAINFGTSIVALTLTINILLRIKANAIKNEVKQKQISKKIALQLKGRNEQLIKTNHELDRFVYSASHDLSAPIKSINGLASVAILEDEHVNCIKHFESIKMLTLKLDDVIRDILDYSKNRNAPLENDLVDIKNIIDKVITEFAHHKNYHLIQFTVNISSQQPVYLDPWRLQMILTHLIDNAITYHEYTTKDAEIIISTNIEDDLFVLTVCDNGPGISAEHQERIFDMFYRASLKSAGTGMGLYIVKEAAMALGGNVEVQSKEPTGSKFIIKIPEISYIKSK